MNSQAKPLAMPRRRQLILVSVAIVVAVSALYVLLPALAGLTRTWDRLFEADVLWLVLAAGLEILSFLSYVVAFRCVFGGGSITITRRESYRITMAGVVATRLLATAGAGGIALTVWALDKAGMPRREIAVRQSTFLVLLYGIFMAALVIGGTGLRTGVLTGPAPLGLTLVPAAFGALVIGVALAAMFFSEGLESAGARFATASSRLTRAFRAAATVPATLASGVRQALALVRARQVKALGALGWWGFDVAVLAACLKAFGGAPTISVIVMAYFVGMLANTLPIPGGVGAVDGGIIGALIGFGVDAGLAIVAVLTYRLFAFWLPIVPGTVAFVGLLRAGHSGNLKAG